MKTRVKMVEALTEDDKIVNVEVEVQEDACIQLNRVYLRDCLEGMHFIPDQSIDCIICDLPFGTTNNPWDQIIPYDKLWEQYNRIVKPEGHIILFSSEPFSTALKASNLENLQYDYVWNKKAPANFKQSHTKPLKDFEMISVFRPAKSKVLVRETFYFPQGLVRCDRTMKNKKGKYMGNKNARVGKTYVQKYTNYPKAILEFSKDADSWHPTQKPVALIEFLIKTYSLPGGIVLDNCMGSFTTAIAAHNTNRYFIGFETNLTYYTRGYERFTKHVMNNISKPLTMEFFEEYHERNEEYFITRNNLHAANPEEDVEIDVEYQDVEDVDVDEDVITTELDLGDIDYEAVITA